MGGRATPSNEQKVCSGDLSGMKGERCVEQQRGEGGESFNNLFLHFLIQYKPRLCAPGRANNQEQRWTANNCILRRGSTGWAVESGSGPWPPQVSLWAWRDGHGGQNHQGVVRPGQFTEALLREGQPRTGRPSAGRPTAALCEREAKGSGQRSSEVAVLRA